MSETNPTTELAPIDRCISRTIIIVVSVLAAMGVTMTAIVQTADVAVARLQYGPRP